MERRLLNAHHHVPEDELSIRKFASALSACVVVFALSACSAETPDPTTVEAVQQSASASPEPSATEVEKPEAEPGSRESPLKPGQARKLSERSAWTVGATKTVVHDGWIQAEFTIGIDWKNLEEQNIVQDGGSFYPFHEVSITFLGTDGTTYDSVDVPMEAFMDGYTDPYVEVYAPKKSITGSQVVAVPEGKVEGGLWVASNVVGDRVFIAQN